MRADRPPQRHISVSVFGRALFGLMALLSTVAFGVLAAALAFTEPVGIVKELLRDALVNCFAIGSFFLLLATMSFWSIGKKWVDPVLNTLAPKATLVIFAFGCGISVFALAKILWR